MSKHQKEVRRERRKDEAGRRRRSFLKPQASSLRTGGAAALAAAAAIAAGTSAYADPVRYDNPAGPGHYDWVPSDPSDLAQFLDISAPGGDQPSDGLGAADFRQRFNTSDAGGEVQSGFMGLGELQIGGPYGVWLLGVDSGELIPSGLTWGPEGLVYWPGVGSELPDGVQTYLGVRFNPGDGFHYGWIGVTRTGASDEFLDAFAWGYETEAGVPIPAGAPEPGTLALLAMGAVGVLSRRRR